MLAEPASDSSGRTYLLELFSCLQFMIFQNNFQRWLKLEWGSCERCFFSTFERVLFRQTVVDTLSQRWRRNSISDSLQVGEGKVCWLLLAADNDYSEKLLHKSLILVSTDDVNDETSLSWKLYLKSFLQIFQLFWSQLPHWQPKQSIQMSPCSTSLQEDARLTSASSWHLPTIPSLDLTSQWTIETGRLHKTSSDC